MNYDNPRICIVDTETCVVGNKLDGNKDKLRYIGFRSFRNGEPSIGIFHHSEREKIQRCLNHFDVIVGHNFKNRKYIMSKTCSKDMGYDEKVLTSHGFTIPKSTVIVDTQEITEKRAKGMLYLDFGMSQMSLGYLGEFFKLSSVKSKMNFDILKQEEPLTGDKYQELSMYLKDDLNTTFELFKKYFMMFKGFKKYLPEKDINNWNWIMKPSGPTAYKIICHAIGVPEAYANDDEIADTESYGGGYVLLPNRYTEEGDLYVMDFASLYPHCYMGGNLFSPIEAGSKEIGWNGSGVIPSIYANEVDGIKGTYKLEMGKIEKVIQEFYNERVKWKGIKKKHEEGTPEWIEADSMVLAIKIVINTMYGISGSPKFLNVYNRTTASDCCSMGRRMIKNANTTLINAGYDVLYTDTDSAYIKDPFMNRKRLEKVAKYIEDTQRASFNIPVETHEFEIESKLKRIYFFKDINGTFKKKCYIYITDTGKIKEKGIKIVKGDCSPIAKRTYEKYIKPLIQNETYEELPYNDVKQWVTSVAKEEPKLLERRYRVNDFGSYVQPTCINAQISKYFGTGEHYLITNVSSGPGSDNKYDTLENLQRLHGENYIDYVVLGKYISDLQDFIKVEERNLIDYDTAEMKRKLRPEYILREKVIRMDGDPMENIITVILEFPHLALRTFNVKESYNSKNGIGPQLLERYGPGEHEVVVTIENKKRKYLKMDDIKDLRNELCTVFYMNLIK